MRFKIGDRVKLVSMRYRDTEHNPLWGGRLGRIEGTIVGGQYTLVDWDNGANNSYNENDLEKLNTNVWKGKAQ